MNLNDYEGIWKRQELPAGTADLSALRNTFEAKRRRLAATLLVRDLLEASAGLFVSGVFTSVWWHIGKEGWPLAFAIALVLGVSGFFARERFRAHRRRLGPATPLLAKVAADIDELRHQRRLLRNIWSWYLRPLAAAILIFAAALIRVLIIEAPPGLLAVFGKHPALMALIALYPLAVLPACFWVVWAINRRAVRKVIEPRIEELEKLHHDLLSTD